MSLSDQVLAGDRRALARLITQLENDAPSAREALAALWPHTGRAHVVGVTGAPGTGKSTLVNEIAKCLRAASPPARTVGIIAVDPTSPFSGGAILGDRIRMRDLAGDSGVFIRSMATRGSLGGLARATSDAVQALDAGGFDAILIETVGAGQSEVEIARTAHTVIVVVAPGMGDEVQAIKAGILEIADIFVVNKSDQAGAEATVRALRAMLELGGRQQAAGSEAGWGTPICQTTASEGKGIGDVVEAMDRHRAHLRASGELRMRERERVVNELQILLRETLLARLMDGLGNGQFEAAVDRVMARESDPRSEVEGLVRAAREEGG
ncbi:MAG: methylmalonyl Co-A mutase-associated GTPase MeaB [Chloroflexi bacterium]|nr:methylmalonyl Co-A mutase-associated GTPase MeaB [Chloroflexota bacterium]